MSAEQSLSEIVARLEKLEKNREQYEEPDLRDLMPTRSDVPMLIAGLGAGSAGAIEGYLEATFKSVSDWVSKQTNAQQAKGIIEAIVGWLIYAGARRHQYISPFGGGIFIKGVGDIVEPSINQFATSLESGGGGGGGTQTTGGTTTTADVNALANQYAGGATVITI